MTEEQKKIKKYVNTLERNLRIPLKMKARINEDIGTEIHLKLEEGKSIDDVLQEMGNPEEVAERFNEEFSVYPAKKKPARFVFLILAILILLGEILFGGYLWIFVRNMPDRGTFIYDAFFNGADGPATLFVAGRPVDNGGMLGNWMMSGGLLLGCMAGYFLTCYGKRGERRIYLRSLILSAAGLIVTIAGPLISGTDDYAQWVMLIGTTMIEVVPGFVLNLVMLIISLWLIKKRKKAF